MKSIWQLWISRRCLQLKRSYCYKPVVLRLCNADAVDDISSETKSEINLTETVRPHRYLKVISYSFEEEMIFIGSFVITRFKQFFLLQAFIWINNVQKHLLYFFLNFVSTRYKGMLRVSEYIIIINSGQRSQYFFKYIFM